MELVWFFIYIGKRIEYRIYNIQNGLLEGESGSKTKKYDVNINYYPGIDLPSISLSGGRHFREGGDSAMDWNEFLALCDLTGSGLQEVTLVDNATCYNTWFFLDDTDDIAPDNGEGDGVLSETEWGYADQAQVWMAPSYSKIDLHVNYDLPVSLGNTRMSAFLHVFNALDAMYVQDAYDNSSYNSFNDDGDRDASSAEVFLGTPRYFNLGLTVNF